MLRRNASGYLEGLSEAARQSRTTVILGIPDRQGDKFHNTVIAIGQGQGEYAKRRLVPFGEYVPFENQLRGIIALFDLPMSHNQSGPAEQAPLIAGDLRVSVSICYEVVYPELVRSSVVEPDLLVTLSNDTWFGRSIGPWQHLQMARMRALENGRGMLRATNNGVTAIINHRGKITASLPQFQQGVLSGHVEIRSGVTPFHQFGSGPTLLFCLMVCVLAWMRKVKSQAVAPDLP